MRSFLVLASLTATFFFSLYDGAGSAGYTHPSTKVAGSAVSAPARQPVKSDYSVLYRFQGTPDGASPYSGLAFENGTLFGTTLNGSSNYCSKNCQSNDCYLGCGTVFSITAAGERVIYNFRGNFNNAGDGSWPFAGLLWFDGAFYGTTSSAGPANQGTVFSVTKAGKERVLHAFEGSSDGYAPEAPLIATNGSLYGTTVYGGSTGCGGYGCGTVFEVSKTGQEHIVYAFAGGRDGAKAYSGVTVMNGELYGTTLFGGGTGCGGQGCGVIYALKATAKGVTERVLYRFTGLADGAYPNGLTALGGVLYGTTEGGGSRSSGAFFSVTPTGKEKTLYSFEDIPDANLPGAALIAVNGTLYGTSVGGGTSGQGSVFSVTPSGSESVLYSFQGGTDGFDPQGPLVTAGHELYGTTNQGGGTGCGGSGCGTVFGLTI